MVTIIQFQMRDVYGEPRAYPVNAQAIALAKLVGTKTLTEDTLRQAAAMGFTLEQVAFGANLPFGLPAARRVA